MATPAQVTRPLTYEEYLRGPVIRQRYEIIHGVMEYMSPSPTTRHQDAVLEWGIFLRTLTRRLGKVFIAPVDVIVSKKPLRTRQPDILFVSNARLGIIKDQLEGGPDIVVEILSPSNYRKSVLEKLADYAALNVRECWMANLFTRTLEIWRNEKNVFQLVGTYGIGQRVRSSLLPAFTVPARLFPKN